ncbi:hypothetical protein QVD17_18698 [Tagetes erecta]|uniref:Cytochrome P450 n=1 Tax=Tagetes erecta TaxID=13708 RepID=A0AAD8KL59_TARER|nr:hypothetical protein QVD17_18698 [Tagetes erecta]
MSTSSMILPLPMACLSSSLALVMMCGLRSNSDLFVARTDMSSSTVEWTMTEVLRNPRILTKAKEELEQVIGKGGDPTVWEDALEFKPERFLEYALGFRGRDFDLIPFGAGRRICPGLPLAIRMIPIMLGSLVNNFDWLIDAKIHPEALNMTEKFGITLTKAKPLCVVPIPLN